MGYGRALLGLVITLQSHQGARESLGGLGMQMVSFLKRLIMSDRDGQTLLRKSGMAISHFQSPE